MWLQLYLWWQFPPLWIQIASFSVGFILCVLYVLAFYDAMRDYNEWKPDEESARKFTFTILLLVVTAISFPVILSQII